MPVLYEDPRSFAIQKFIIAHPNIGGKKFSVINPDSHQEINRYLVNIPEFGLTSQNTPDHVRTTGFLGDVINMRSLANKPSDHDNTFGKEFPPEAYLKLDTSDILLPEGIKGEIWLLQVVDEKDKKLYTSLADELCKYFEDVTIIISFVFRENIDPNTVEGTLVYPELKKGPVFCPIGITRVVKYEVEASINAKKRQE